MRPRGAKSHLLRSTRSVTLGSPQRPKTRCTEPKSLQPLRPSEHYDHPVRAPESEAALERLRLRGIYGRLEAEQLLDLADIDGDDERKGPGDADHNRPGAKHAEGFEAVVGSTIVLTGIAVAKHREVGGAGIACMVRATRRVARVRARDSTAGGVEIYVPRICWGLVAVTVDDVRRSIKRTARNTCILVDLARLLRERVVCNAGLADGPWGGPCAGVAARIPLAARGVLARIHKGVTALRRAARHAYCDEYKLQQLHRTHRCG